MVMGEAVGCGGKGEAESDTGYPHPWFTSVSVCEGAGSQPGGSF